MICDGFSMWCHDFFNVTVIQIEVLVFFRSICEYALGQLHTYADMIKNNREYNLMYAWSRFVVATVGICDG